MRIAVLSGKGGTGKTLVSVNMAAAAKTSNYIDCDIEEPNGHLFFKPEGIKEKEIAIKIPSVNEQLCNGCRICVDFCKFNALAYINGTLKIFDEVCHSCGGCALFCPEKALSEKDKVIGKVQKGISDNVTVNTGILNIGEASGIPIIKKLLAEASSGKDITFIDCPLVIMAGKKDHITPPEQAFALKHLVKTPAHDIIEILTEGGHIGTLMGNEALKTNWTQVNEMLQMVI